MIETVLGPIRPEDLGTTLTHEHIIWDFNGTGEGRSKLYTRREALDYVLPYLMNLRQVGCRTLVEATTYGAGRDVELLRTCSQESGLNIITNTGAWDGDKYRGQLVPQEIREKTADEVAKTWIAEIENGIEGTGVKPGYIKLAMGDEWSLTELQQKLLRAAARASRVTGLVVQCHVCPPPAAQECMAVVEEEGLRPSRFIWVHADAAQDVAPIMAAAERGFWVELDCLARAPGLEFYAQAIRKLDEGGFLGQVLCSQDAGCFNVGEKNDGSDFFPYDRVFKEAMPLWLNRGVSKSMIDRIFVENPAKALEIG